MIAVYFHNPPMVRLLLRNGAKVNDTIHIMPNDEYGEPVHTSVLDLAELVSTHEIVNLLRDT